MGLLYLVLILASATALITIDNNQWVEYAGNPVYDPLDHRAYYPCVILDDDGLYTMWYDDGSNMRFANSTDGITWLYVGACTGIPNARHGWVLRTGPTTLEMWYWDSAIPGQPYNNASLRHANSTDGLVWFFDTVVLQDPIQPLIVNPEYLWNEGSYGPCSLLFDPAIVSLDKVNITNNRYIMYYDGSSGGDEAIGVAGSLDGIYFVGNPTGLPVLGGPATPPFDPYYQSRSTVLYFDDRFHMWYSWGIDSMDDCINYAESADGINWEDDPNNPIFCYNDSVSWRLNRTYTPSVLLVDGVLRMWFTGVNGSDYAIGYTTLSLPTTTTTTAPGSVAIEVGIVLGSVFGFILLLCLCLLVCSCCGYGVANDDHRHRRWYGEHEY